MEYKWLRRSTILFFIVTSFFSVSWGYTHLPSPDETANMFFIREYVRTGQLRVAEPLNVVGEDLIHPRAVNIVQHNIVPGSFLGLILLYGWIANIVGVWIVPFLTPAIATIASLFFYKLVRAIFDERIARWSFFLLLTHPAWIYYTARSMFPNVLFLSLLIIGLYYLVKCQMHALSKVEGSNVKCFFLAGLLIGAALTVRTAEAGWVLGGLLLCFFLLLRQKRHYTEFMPRHQFGIMRILVFGVGLVIAFLPIFYYNNELYGHPFYNGYSQIDSEAVPAAFAWHFRSRFLSTLFSILLPFGVKPMTLLANAYQYGLWFFWWLAIPTALGIVLIARSVTESQNHPGRRATEDPRQSRDRITESQKQKSVSLFLCFFVFMTAWLLLYYGSWQFRDTTLLGATLGTSFTRYWLPIFVGGIPFAVYALFTLRELHMRIGIALIFFLSLSTVFVRGDESLFTLRRTARDGKNITKIVRERTESYAVILTERADKLFFPERRVIFNDSLDQVKIDRVVAKLRERVPVYFFTALLEHDIDFTNRYRFVQYGVAWRGGEKIEDQRLYRLEKL